MTRRLFMALMVLWLAGCSSLSDDLRQGRAGTTEQGLASFYADKYQGRTTANGERFDQNAMTAAHKTLPFGTKVRVTNLANNRSIVVRINDRGPFVRGRIIDLSRHGFRQIADLNQGLVEVRVEVLP
ncbi:septal ring lytic transglycosylase RlpA family protein [Ferrimonas balearica]|uniref:septal ring lytic transglycosylase RlpA family protein n=1 Tax=Ferrimonas balearica TaxID=44012 RepID=UPI001C9946F3|nr:septal ring lytic transglycosylase RlpA family protein [Ferrimonas balearica]MBY5991852.1 septal ring lytic transglycosylase RlpA family protein [Ferrimonas balearica]